MCGDYGGASFSLSIEEPYRTASVFRETQGETERAVLTPVHPSLENVLKYLRDSGRGLR